jgi:hypothetical protein
VSNQPRPRLLFTRTTSSDCFPRRVLTFGVFGWLLEEQRLHNIYTTHRSYRNIQHSKITHQALMPTSIMSTTRQLPQRPGQTPPDERGFVYPPYPRPQPPYERHNSYPIPQSPGMYGGPVNHPPPPPGHERSYFQPPPDPHSRPYGIPPGYVEQNGHGPVPESNGEGKKKRPRELSLSSREADKSPPARPSTSKQSKPDSGSDGKAAPSVLVREKKQVR